MNIDHDTAAALSFLQQWQPQGPWILTAISPEKAARATETKTCHTPEEFTAWVNPRQGKKNLYFMVNGAKRPLSSKASKKDVSQLIGLHVDVDPRPGEDIARERTRALAALNAFEPKPTVIIDSGGGYQAFWKLREPGLVTGEEDIEKLERYTRALAEKLGGDTCYNIDRIMRLPGTVNLPGERKRNKGRKPALAKVVEEDWSRLYTLDDFPKAEMAPPTVVATVTPARLADLPKVNVDELPVDDRCKAIIRCGHDPNNPGKHPSRSEWLFSVCCQLVRAKCEDEVVLAVITNWENRIAASVLEKRNPLDYAARQLTKAKAVTAEPPELQEMNEKHFAVGMFGGKFRVATKRLCSTTNRQSWVFQNKSDFLDTYANQQISVGINKKGLPIMEPLGQWWLKHPMRRQYQEVVFAPGKEVAESQFNLWEGFAYAPKEGEMHHSYLDHIQDNICDGDARAFYYLIRWMARAVQEPDKTGEVAVVLIGDKGTGKGQFAGHFGKLFGRHYVTISDPRHLTGNFNAHLQDCVVLFADEAMPASNTLHRSVLKALITEPRIMIERKGVDGENMDNLTHIIMASNERHAVHYTQDERRYFVLHVGNAQKQNSAYFARIKADMEDGGYSNLLHYLQNLDISEWEHRDIYVTKAAREQMMASLGPSLYQFLDILHAGILPGTDAQKKGEPDLMCLKTAAEMLGKESTKLHHELCQEGIITNPQPIQRRAWRNPDGSVVTSNPEPGATSLPRRMYRVAPLADLRQRFDAFRPEGGWPYDNNVWRLESDPDPSLDNLPF